MSSETENTLRERCSECQILMKCKKAINFEGKRICRNCHRKHVIIIPTNPQIFREPVDVHYNVCLNMTQTQDLILKKRLKYLFPHSKQTTSAYVRGLILGDLKQWLDKEAQK